MGGFLFIQVEVPLKQLIHRCEAQKRGLSKKSRFENHQVMEVN